MTRIKQSFLNVLILFALLLSGCAASTTFRVLDAETKEPIEGAVALAEWIGGSRMGIIAGPTFAHTAKVVEVVTDSEGKFMIPVVGGSLAMQTPHIKIYKPGYVGWDSRRIYLGYRGTDIKRTRAKKRVGFTMKDQDISLEPWTDEYSFISHSSFIDTNADFGDVGMRSNDSKYLKAIDYEIPFYVKEKNMLQKKRK
jgi:hypothetical protein